MLDTTEQGYGATNFKAEQQTNLSPCHHVKNGLMPTIIFHGTADKTVPVENAERFTTLMKEAGNDCVRVPLAGRDHGFFNGMFARPQSDGADDKLTMKRTAEFLADHDYRKLTSR